MPTPSPPVPVLKRALIVSVVKERGGRERERERETDRQRDRDTEERGGGRD